MLLPSRRTLLTGLAAAALASPAAARSRRVAARAVTVDVERLRFLGLGPFADLVGDALAAELQRVLAGRLGDRRVVVRLTGLTLSSFADPGGSPSRIGSDYLDGEASIVDGGGAVISQFPQLLALPSDTGGAWYLAGNEQRRAAALAQAYAGWIARRVT